MTAPAKEIATPGTHTITEPGVYDLTEAERIAVGDTHWALIDASDCRRLQVYNWRLLAGHNGRLYAVAHGGHVTGIVYMHRLVLGTPKGLETDHINGNGLDNRRANLRIASASQNRANMGKPRRPDGSVHTSRFKGVSWDRSRGKWQAQIRVEGRCRNLGRFDDEVSAAKAYDAAAATAWAEYARLNFPACAERAPE